MRAVIINDKNEIVEGKTKELNHYLENLISSNDRLDEFNYIAMAYTYNTKPGHTELVKQVVSVPLSNGKRPIIVVGKEAQRDLFADVLDYADVVTVAQMQKLVDIQQPFIFDNSAIQYIAALLSKNAMHVKEMTELFNRMKLETRPTLLSRQNVR